jgi:chemotaxis protein CheD
LLTEGGTLRNYDNNQKVSDVQTGQVKTGRGKVILQSKAIGSCVAIVAYDATKHIGALAHIMLPGRAPAKKAAEKTRYAADAIDAIVNKMTALGSKIDDIEVALVGGGNILDRKDDTICYANIESVQELLEEKHLKVRAQAVGGIVRRNVSLDVERGIISYTEGDGSKKQLWKAKEI